MIKKLLIKKTELEGMKDFYAITTLLINPDDKYDFISVNTIYCHSLYNDTHAGLIECFYNGEHMASICIDSYDIIEEKM